MKRKVRLGHGSHSWPHFKLITSTRIAPSGSERTSMLPPNCSHSLGLGSTFLKCPKGYNKLHRVSDHTGQGLVLTAPRGLWETLKMLPSRAVLSINTSPTVNLPARQSCSHPKALGKVGLSSTHLSRTGWGNPPFPLRYRPVLPQDSRSCLWAQFPL